MTGLVRLMPPSGPVRPDSYDFSFESYFDGIGASGFFLRGPGARRDVRSGAADAFSAPRSSVRETRSPTVSADRIGGAGRRDRRRARGRRARRHPGRGERGAAPRRHLPHHLDFRPAYGAGRRHHHGLLRAGFALFPDFSSRRPVKKYAAALAHRRPCRLSLHLRRGGGRATQLHHARRHADGGAVRPCGAHHAQSRHLGDRRHRDLAARGHRAELPDVICRDRRAGRRLCGLVGLRRAGRSSPPPASRSLGRPAVRKMLARQRLASP